MNSNTSHLGFNEGTTAQDSTSRRITEEQNNLDTIDALTKHYKTEAEEEEARFKLEEERRKTRIYGKTKTKKTTLSSKS